MSYTEIGRIRPRPMGEWTVEKEYEVLDVVMQPDGASAFMAVQNVPAGIALAQSDYWMPIVDINAAVDATKEVTDAVQRDVAEVKDDLDKLSNFTTVDYKREKITNFVKVQYGANVSIHTSGKSYTVDVEGGYFYELKVSEKDIYIVNTKVTTGQYRYLITNDQNDVIQSLSSSEDGDIVITIPKNGCALLINNNENIVSPKNVNIYKCTLSDTLDKKVYYATALPKGFESLVNDGVTDNTRQLQAILDYMADNGGGTLVVKDGIYIFNERPLEQDNYNSIIKIPYVASTTASPVPINIIGENEIATAYPENVAVPPIQNGAIFLITCDTTGLENTTLPSFIGAKHTGSETYNNQDYTDVTLNIKNLIFRQQQQGVLTDLQLKYVANVNLENIVCDCIGDYATLIYSGYNTSHGVIMPTLNNYGFERIRNLYVIGRGTGLKHSEHLDADNLFFQRCGTAISVQQSHHASYYGKILVQDCIFAITGEGQARIYSGVLDVELNEGDNYKFINDYNNNLYGDITIHAVFGGIGAKNDMETISKYIGGANNLVINTEEIPILIGDTDSEKLANLINILKTKKMIR